MVLEEIVKESRQQAPRAHSPPHVPVPVPETALEEVARAAAARRVAERKARKLSERRTYLVAAVMSSLGVTSMAVAAVYYRFSWQMEVSRGDTHRLLPFLFSPASSPEGCEC